MKPLSVRELSFSQDGSKLVIYAAELGEAVWVVNVSSAQLESRHPTLGGINSGGTFFGSARLSPDNRCLYLARSDYVNYRYSIQCLDLTTDKELWQTESQQDRGFRLQTH